MANPKPKTEQLSMFESKWRKRGNSPRDTKLSRFPKDLLEEVTAIALWADSTENPKENLKRLLAIAYQLDKQPK